MTQIAGRDPSSKPLPLKWRPQNFSEIIGQNHIVRILSSAVKRHRVGQAYLFSGPRGSGKTSTARILAKSLNCVNGPTPDPCQTCDPCMEITNGRSPDVIEIDGASNRGINEIRNLQELLRFRPMGGKWKIIIIDEVHMLTTEAFNALLKTLEEPPPHVVFIFATTEPQKVPLTILSRCQHLEFHRIREDEIYRRLIQVCEAESISAEPEALRLIARSADGSLRDALSLLEQARVYTETTISPEQVADILGLVRPGRLLPLARYLGHGNLRESLLEYHRLLDEGHDVRSIMEELLRFFRQVLWQRLQPDHPVALIQDEETLNLAHEVLERLREEDILRICDQLLACLEKLRLSEDPIILGELTLTRICRLPALLEIERLIDMIQNIPIFSQDDGADIREIPEESERKREKTPSRPLIPEPESKKPSDSREKTVSSENPEERLLEKLRSLKGWKVALNHMKDLTVDHENRQVRLTIPESFARIIEKLLASGGDARVRELIHATIGKAYPLVLNPVPNHVNMDDIPSNQSGPSIQDPDVQRYQEVLGGTILSIESSDEDESP